MDYSLRCNSLKCRTQLDDRAVVTTCSHIFCLPCSESLGLANPNASARVCPACETQLANPDDAVVTQLNPTEDYKTSVLSGLSPSIIMECAGRGLSFYSYQTTQEIIYQEFLARSLTDKYSTLSSQMDKIIKDANDEITTLREKLSNMNIEQKKLEEKNLALVEAYREKNKKHSQLNRMYNGLKQQQLAGGMELAADHDAENILQAGAGGPRSTSAHRNGQAVYSRAESNASGGTGGRRHNNPGWNHQSRGNRDGLQNSNSYPVPATPSGHRTRLPVPLYGNSGTNNVVNNDTIRQGTPFRPALHKLDPNVYGNSNHAGYGMSAGIKVGRPQNGPIDRNGMGRSTGVGGWNIR